MKKKANNQDILSLDEILNQTEAPDFLNKKGKMLANYLNEPQQQQQPEKKIKVNPVIEKTARVNVDRAKEIKGTQQNLENFKQYLELSKFARHVSKPSKSQQNQHPQSNQIQQQSKKINKKKQQTVKEKEKQRRMKGQSSIATWKSEDEMKLRQQFD